MRYTKKLKKTKKQSKKQIKKGGKISKKCLANPENFPKCGNEGCVYLDDKDTVIKQQWIPNRDMPSYLLSLEGQRVSTEIAPTIFSDSKTPCNLISTKGLENKAPCFVKRFRKTKSGDKIVYEEEKRDSWCRSYGKKNQCVVDDNMYEKFKRNVRKTSMDIPNGTRLPEGVLPDIDSSQSDGNPNAIDDENLGDLDNDVDISPAFTGIDPVFLTYIKMNRVKGITIGELMKEMFTLLGEEKTMSVGREWEEEKEKIIARAKTYGYKSRDFHEENIMIDVDDETLCDWIDSTIETGEPITPDMIKEKFGKTNILKIVDWGLLEKVKRNAAEE